MTYFNQVTNPKKEMIIRIVKRPKGLILGCTNYDCFIYKESKFGVMMNQILVMFEQDSMYQRELYIVPNKSIKQGFIIEAGKNVPWFHDQYYNWSTELDETEEFIQNTLEQFKLDTTSLPTNAHENPKESNRSTGDDTDNPKTNSKGSRRTRKAP